LEEAFHSPIHALEKDRLRAGPAAPDAAQPGREEEKAETQRGEQEDDEPEVLRVERLAEEVEVPIGNIQEDRRLAIDADEGQGDVDGDQDGVEGAPTAQEAPFHVRGMDRLP